MLPKVLLALALLASTVHAQQFKPLWDGKTLTGWHIIGTGEWKVEGDTIAGRHSRTEPGFGHLVTDAVYGDFTVRLKYKTVSGNSGLYFRIDETGFSGVSGFQAEIDPLNDAGGLYETNGRSWLIKPAPEQVKSWFKPEEWNEMTVSAKGTKVTVTVNGKVSAVLDDEKGRRQGRIALQLHGGQEGFVYFKEIEIEGEPVVQ
ncbi:MAG: hypothetical protein JWL90_898 [Chthoniobacteraceae bacterium]|nr:hypothetical protein [Chthoniobacteraceae bacterium]